MPSQIQTFYTDNERHMYRKECKFNVGDIVKVSNFGDIYDTYDRAYKALHLKRLGLRNYVEDGGQYSPRLDMSTQHIVYFVDNPQRNKWVIKDIALHEGGGIMYFVVNAELRIGLLVCQCGLKLVKPTEKIIQKNYIAVQR